MKRHLAACGFLVATLVGAGAVRAQDYPWPVPEGSPVAMYYGKPTPPFRAPFTRHVGRYHDSTITAPKQAPIRTYRAGNVRIAPERDRVYMKYGETFASYKLSTFFTSDLGQPLRTLTGTGREPGEQYLPFYGSVYAEARNSGWSTSISDSQQRLGPLFDWDDRGYVYLPYTFFGWGIVTDSPGSMPLVKQVTDDVIVSPKFLQVVKVGAKYYVFVAGTSSAIAVYDVTNPSSPQLIRVSNDVSAAWMAKAEVGGEAAFAYADLYTQTLRIYRAADFVAGKQPVLEVAAGAKRSFWKVESDGRDFYAVEGKRGEGGSLRVYRPVAGTVSSYQEVLSHSLGAFFPTGVAVAGSYITVLGTDSLGSKGRLFRLSGSSVTEIDLGSFLRDYYSGGLGASYAYPGFCSAPNAFLLWSQGGKDYLIWAGEGLGDVYELGGSGRVGVSVSSAAGWGTRNTKSPTAGEGPYYGDVITFLPTASDATKQVTLDFDNDEAGSAGVAQATTGQQVKYQYSGLTSVTTARSVTVTDNADPTNTASMNVVMREPSARVLVSSSGQRLTSATSLTTPLVPGDGFYDASDGSTESHFAEWTLDGAPTRQTVSSMFGAGSCGDHSLSFKALYGAYTVSGDVFTPRNSSDFSSSVTNISYSVRPFVPTIVPTLTSGTLTSFTAVVARGAGVSDAAATFEWVLTSPGATPITLSTPGTLSSPPQFPVGASVPAGSEVTLKVTVADASTFPSGCTTYTSATAQPFQLAVPDPKINKTGCATVGSDCSFTVTSTAGGATTGWSYAWKLDTVAKTAGATFSPTSLTAGSHTVEVTVTNIAGLSASASETFTVEQPLCVAPTRYPTFSVSGCSGTCTTADTVKFTPFVQTWGECDRFEWDFGDGQKTTKTTPEAVTHKYSSNKTYTVTFTITSTGGMGSSVPFKQSVTIGSGPTPDPDPTPTCARPNSNVTFTFTGPSSGCQVGGSPCAPAESIQFSAVNYPVAGFQSCDRFEWTFGDGGTSTSQSPRHAFASGGSYSVRLRIHNTAGERVVTRTVAVGAQESCTAPGSLISVTYAGATSGCKTADPSARCVAGETITLTAVPWQYVFQACDRFEWNFGDNKTQTTTTPTVQHTYDGTTSVYNVTLTVRNTAGSRAASGAALPFGDPVAKPTSVDFTFAPTTASVGTAVTFTGTATSPAGHPITQWKWNFEEGPTLYGNPVQHTFSTAGNWKVTLTASNAGGAAPPLTKEVKVVEANAFAYLLPVVSHNPGANDSRWRTDLQIYNSNVAEGPVELEFELTNAGIKKTFTLNTSTVIYEDFMGFFRDDDWAGPVIVRGAATHDLQIWTRTYSVGASGIGTYGHLIPAVRIDGQSFTAGETNLYMSGVSRTDTYRTNLYLLNITNQTMPVSITAYEGRMGAAVGQLLKDVQPFQLTPISATEIPGAPTDRPFSVAIKGTSDGLIAYESVLDNTSNDPAYIPALAAAQLADPAMRTQVLPSVGHVGQWRSDVTVFNPDDQAVQFDLAFHKDATGELIAEAKDQILPAKGLLQLDDIVWSHPFVPQLTSDAVGTLRVTVDSPLAHQFVVVSQRNYAVGGDGRRFGQGVLGFAASKPNVLPGKPAILPAVRSDQLYKSNVGLVNVSATDASVAMTLLDAATGQPIGIYSATLKPNESRILPDAIPQAFFQPATDRGSIKVEVTNDAAVWAFAVIIDKSTSDPEYVPAIPLD